jgi:hypothetical protein
MFRRLLLLGLLLPLAAAGCASRAGHHATEALEWLRLKDAATVERRARWQLPVDAKVAVQELTPAPHPAWLAAAEQAVGAAFPGHGSPGAAEFRLLVAWPAGPEALRTSRVTLAEMIRLDPFLPDFQGPMELQVMLVRAADDGLVDAARLEVSPHWFTAEARSPALVHAAFRELAATLRPAY